MCEVRSRDDPRSAARARSCEAALAGHSPAVIARQHGALPGRHLLTSMPTPADLIRHLSPTIHVQENAMKPNADNLLTTFSTDPAGLDESIPSERVVLQDGDAFELDIGPVARQLGEDRVRMLA